MLAGGRKKGRSMAIINQSSNDSEGEAFDYVSDRSSESVGDPMPVATTGNAHVRPTRSGRSRPQAQAAPAAADLEPERTVVAPIAPIPPAVPIAAQTSTEAARLSVPTTRTSGSGRQAQDINYFYSKREIDVKGVMTMRNVCTLCW
jgi:hypothetical protein